MERRKRMLNERWEKQTINFTHSAKSPKLRNWQHRYLWKGAPIRRESYSGQIPNCLPHSPHQTFTSCLPYQGNKWKHISWKGKLRVSGTEWSHIRHCAHTQSFPSIQCSGEHEASGQRRDQASAWGVHQAWTRMTSLDRSRSEGSRKGFPGRRNV